VKAFRYYKHSAPLERGNVKGLRYYKHSAPLERGVQGPSLPGWYRHIRVLEFWPGVIACT